MKTGNPVQWGSHNVAGGKSHKGGVRGTPKAIFIRGLIPLSETQPENILTVPSKGEDEKSLRGSSQEIADIYVQRLGKGRKRRIKILEVRITH